MAKDVRSIGRRSTGSSVSSPSAIGGNKEVPSKNRKINTAVNLFGRVAEIFSRSANKKGSGVSTTGGK